MDFAESTITRDQKSRLRQDQAEERRSLLALLRRRAALGPTPRSRSNPRDKHPTADMVGLDAQIRVVRGRLETRAKLIESVTRRHGR